jgi:hypothetical protein
VELHFCQAAATYTVDLKNEERCYAPCRGDCRVSEWSHWSHCHRNCQAADVGQFFISFILHSVNPYKVCNLSDIELVMI